MENNKATPLAAERLKEHAEIICNYAEAILDELTILKAIMAGDEETVSLLQNL